MCLETNGIVIDFYSSTVTHSLLTLFLSLDSRNVLSSITVIQSAGFDEEADVGDGDTKRDKKEHVCEKTTKEEGMRVQEKGESRDSCCTTDERNQIKSMVQERRWLSCFQRQ